MSYQPRRMQGEDPYKKMRKMYEEEGRGDMAKSRKQSSKKGKVKTKANVFFQILAVIYVAITIIFYVSILKLNKQKKKKITRMTTAEITITLLIGVALSK